MLKKLYLILTLVTALFAPVPVNAIATSILPNLDENSTNYPCNPDDSATWDSFLQQVNAGSQAYRIIMENSGIDTVKDFFACAVKTGYVKFWMIPYFILYALQFVIQLAGLIAVLMVVLGGYYYIAGGITDDKEKGKTIITYALGGFVLVLTSWFIVNVILLALTT